MVYSVEPVHRSHFRNCFRSYIKKDISAVSWHVMYLSIKADGASLGFFCWHMLQSVGNVTARQTTLWHSVRSAQTCQAMLCYCVTTQKTLGGSGRGSERQGALLGSKDVFIILVSNWRILDKWCSVQFWRTYMLSKGLNTPSFSQRGAFLLSSVQWLFGFVPSPLKYCLKGLIVI